MTQNQSSKQYATSLVIILILTAPALFMINAKLSQSLAVIIYFSGFAAAIVFTPIARFIDRQINNTTKTNANAVDIKKYLPLKLGLLILIIIIVAAMIYPISIHAETAKVGFASLIYLAGAVLGLTEAVIISEFPSLVSFCRK
ncbi:MAG: hypothetical protein Q4Q53_02915 [Methanocorpusculum sp.]|nr:hypothetical protein [Methanocorpusculum sp.]